MKVMQKNSFYLLPIAFLLCAFLWLPSNAEESSGLKLQEGFSLLSQGKTKLARGVFSLCTDEAYLLSDYIDFGVAQSYFDEENYLKALQSYQKVMQDHPKSALIPTSLLQAGKCYFHLKNFSKAEKIFHKIVGDYKLSAAVKEADRLLEKSKTEIAKQKGAKPAASTSLTASLGLDASETLKNLYAEAKRKRYKSKYATYYRLFYEATNYWINKDYRRASYYYKRLYNQYPGWRLGKYSYFMYGRSELRRGRVTSSIKIFQKSITLGGIAVPEAHYYLSFAYSYKGQASSGIKSLKKLVTNYPKSTYAQKAAFEIGKRYERKKELKSAIWAYKNFLEKYPDSPLADDAAAKVGILYYKIGNPEKAYTVLSSAYEKYSNNDHTNLITYWLGKAALDAGNKEQATAAFKRVMERDKYGYYAYRAMQQLQKQGIYPEKKAKENGIEVDVALFKIKENEVDSSHILDIWGALRSKANYSEALSGEKFSSNIHYQKYSALFHLGLYKYAAIEAGELAHNERVLLPLGKVLFAIGEFRGPVILADSYIRREISTGTAQDVPKEVWLIAYPLAFWEEVKHYAKKHKLDPFLILAVMREESHFGPGAMSRARAHGLMQIIPSTGKNIAREIGISNFSNSKMFDPKTNIRMGTYYLSTLLKRFKGSEYLALAGYNGGPVRVKRWVKKLTENGKPLDIDLFVESIPLYETRNYVKKVMRSYHQYKRLYGNKIG